MSTSTSTPNNNGEGKMKERINHNACERQRRQRISSLYSSLRSLLPPSHETKKSSIPATVSRMVKYIPQLQEEIDKLLQRKQQLLSINSMQSEQEHDQESKKIGNFISPSVAISTRQLSDNELLIQICTSSSVQNVALSQILLKLEEIGLRLQSFNSFDSSEGRNFHTLLFQIEGSYVLEPEVLKEKLLSMYKKEEEISLSIPST